MISVLLGFREETRLLGGPMRSEAVLGSPRKSQEVPGSPRLGSLAWCEGTSGLVTRRTSFGGTRSAMGMMLRVQCLPGESKKPTASIRCLVDMPFPTECEHEAQAWRGAWSGSEHCGDPPRCGRQTFMKHLLSLEAA